jgi:hypothetical protein
MTDQLEFPAVIDATQIATWRSCHQKSFRTYWEHWKPQGESVHLHAGKAFAVGLEAARTAFYTQGRDAQTAVGLGFQALTAAYGDFEWPEGSNKALDRMQGALLYYFDHAWPLGKQGGATPHQFPSGKHGIEFSFAMPLPFMHPVTGDPIIYAGRSDMICDFAGGVYIEDDKTASQLGALWAKQWDLRSQFTGYCWAARESGLTVNGVLVRGVSILKTRYDHAEAITYRLGWEIDRWLKQVLKDLGDMQRAWETGYWDYALDHACDDYGGCSLRQICKTENPETWLPMYFERRKWDPLERTETRL